MFKKLNLIQIGSGLIILLLLMAFLVPEWAWGFSHLNALPKPLKLVVVVLIAVTFWLLIPKENSRFKIVDLISYKSAIIVLPILTFLLTFFLPMATNAYGDARSILANYIKFFSSERDTITSIIALFEPDFLNLHSGEKFTFNAVYILKNALDISIVQAFQIFDSLLATLSSVFFILSLKKDQKVSYLVSILLFLSGNFFLVFSGHIEVYAPFLFFSFAFVFLLKKHLTENTNLTLALVFASAYFLVNSHISGVLALAPLLAITVLKFKPESSKFFTIKNANVLIISGAVGFILAYFLVFKSQNVAYESRGEDVLSNIFLPLLGTEAPYDNYGLFTLSHFIDYTSLLIMWSVPVFLLLIIRFAFKRDKNGFDSIEMVFFYFLTIAFALTSFVVNPLLSMPRDWDLLSLGAPFALFLSISLLNQSNAIDKLKLSRLIIIAFVAFVIPRFIVESNAQYSSNRLLTIGSRVYKTYYAGSSVLLSMAIKQQKEPDYEKLKVFAEDLSIEARVYPDNELCHFLTQTGLWIGDVQNKKALALDFFRLALEQNNEYEIALKGAAVILQNQNRLNESLPVVKSLLKIQPDIKEYNQMLLNCYLGLEMKKELKIAVNNYLKLFPEDYELIKSRIGI